MIAKKLEQKIRDAILSSARSHAPSLFAQDASGPERRFIVRHTAAVYSLAIILTRKTFLAAEITHSTDGSDVDDIAQMSVFSFTVSVHPCCCCCACIDGQHHHD